MTVRQRLEALGSETMVPGLQRVEVLLDALGSPHLEYPTAIIAGTNGKGSTAAYLASIGGAAGLRVGLYTSPHLARLEERFRIDGQNISATGLDMYLRVVLDAAQDLVARNLLIEHPTYFETLTAAAFCYFAEARAELAVLEVGLGGRLDATNVTMPRVAVITAIDVDHVEWLGSDPAAIAREKFGVVPRGGVAVTAPQSPAVQDALDAAAREMDARVLRASDYPMDVRSRDPLGAYTFDLRARLRHYGGLECALSGPHQMENARCAVLAAEVLDRRRMRIPSHAVWAGLRRTRLPGRFEWVVGERRCVFDGAHNPAAAAALKATLMELRTAGVYDRLHLVMAVMADKDVAGITAELFDMADSVFATRAPGARSAAPETLLQGTSPPARSWAIDSAEDALARALAGAAENDLICVTGSLYLVGHLRPLLVEDPG